MKKIVKMNLCRRLLLLSSAAMLGGMVCESGVCHARRKTPQPSRNVVVIYENDVHCAIERYPLFAGYRDAIMRADTADVFTVSGGDFVQGAFAGAVSKGEYVVDIVKDVKYDAMTLGNHEFDYGFQRMQELVSKHHCPVTCANLTKAGEDDSIFPPYIMKSSGKHHIAFVGVTTPSTMQTSSYSFYDKAGNILYDLHEKNTSELVQRAVDQARKDGADIVILLTHLGEQQLHNTKVNSHAVVSRTRGVDIVLDAHSHSIIPSEWVRNVDGDSVLVTQTGMKLNNIGKLIIHPDAKSRAGKFQTVLVDTKSLSPADFPCKEVESTLDSVRMLIAAKERQVVGYAPQVLSINADDLPEAVRSREMGIGNLLADAFRAIGKTDIALCNAGGIRTGINTVGDITYRSIIDVAPYANDICTAEITGRTLIDGLTAAVASVPAATGGFLQVSGMRFTINMGKPNTVSNVQIERKDDDGNVSWEDVKPEARYTVTSTDYVLYKSRESMTFRQGKIISDMIMPYSEALIKYIQQFPDGRIPEYYYTIQGRINYR